MIVYDRLPFIKSTSANTFRTIVTFLLSAIWHGFYPGYYVTFITGALIVVSARIVSDFDSHASNNKLICVLIVA